MDMATHMMFQGGNGHLEVDVRCSNHPHPEIGV